MGLVNVLEALLHFLIDLLFERFRSHFKSRFDLCGIRLDGQRSVPVLIVEDPALPLGNDRLAEFLFGQGVAPVAESALGKFHDVALVDHRHRLQSALNGVTDAASDELLRAGD